MRWIEKIAVGSTEGGRRFKGPVGWLLGRQLLAGLKFIAIYSLFGPKLDPKDWMTAEPIKLHENDSEQGEFWFDYIADTGDGQKAVYNIAYLCSGDLWVGEEAGKPQVKLRQSAGSNKLPRGRFLFVGGDTAYHISDYETISERFRDPFNWAFKSRAANEGIAPDKRPIYAIPANHDYYDAIDGFNRQFRKPVLSFGEAGPQLELDGFSREQNASYVAIKLPFDWWLWGLDSQNGAIDFRQQAFFRNLSASDSNPHEIPNGNAYNPPKKLIVATPEPSTSYRHWIDERADLVKTFESLGLDCAFLERNDGRLPESHCRLDLSGDIHHYARYWGRGPEEPERTPQSRENYASVVAGGGGAFLHPTHTHGDGITESRLYPDILQSVSLFVGRLLNPWNIARGGYIWAVGGLLSLLLYFAGTIPDSTWSLVPLVSADARPLSLAAADPSTAILAAIQRDLSVAELKPGAQAIDTIPYLPDLLIASTVIGLYLFCALRCARRKSERRLEIKDWKVLKGVLVASGVLAIALVLTLIFCTKSSIPHPLFASLLGIAFLAGGILAIVVTRLYTNLVFDRFKSLSDSDANPEESSRRFSLRDWTENVMLWDYLPSWVLMISAFLSVLFGLWRYGIYKAAVTFSDSVFIVVMVLVVVGLIVYAGGVGAAGLNRRAKLIMLLIGFWHLVLQLGSAAFLVANNDALTTVLVLAAVVGLTLGVSFLVPWLMNRYPQFNDQNSIARFLTLCWLVIGFGCLTFAFTGDAAGEVSVGRMAGAFMTGTVFSCVWFGWYLAVSSACRGHYNEAGGGARADRYRHMVRFKLERDRLTGYVIGIDRPVSDFDPGNLPAFELVDVFTVAVTKK
jgi:hypothetical protein